MTIIKGSSQKSDKAILEKKLLAEALEEGAADPEPQIQVAQLHHQRRRCCFNFFLILLALSVLAAGVVSGLYLYKHLSHKFHKGNVEFEIDFEGDSVSTDRPYFLPEKQMGDEKKMMEPFQKKDFEHFFNNIYKNEYPSHPNHHRKHNPYKVKQEVEVEDNTYEKIHMPRFGIFKETLVLHDFTRNYSGIVDFDEGVCYVMNLNREKITPPRDWFDLIRKFATGYYMPKASVLKRQYRVAEGPLRDIARFGVYIQSECAKFSTYWLEKKVGDGLIEKRSANVVVYGFFNGDNKFIEYDIQK